MKKRVVITKLPTAQSGAELKLSHLRAGLGFNSNVMPWPIMAGKMSEPRLQVNKTLQPVPRHMANLEAEKDEVAMLASKGGVPSTFTIGGQRHTNGGTPLNLPPDSFIFSDTKDMRIKDPKMLAQFGMAVLKAGYTPADIAKKYNVNNFKKILADPDTDDLQRSTAETMIANYNLKLAKLAMLQESMKGFPQGIPVVAMPYIEQMGMDPSQFVQVNPQGDQPGPDDAQMSAYGGQTNDYFAQGGYAKAEQEFKRRVRVNMPQAQEGGPTKNPTINKLVAAYRANPTKENARILTQVLDAEYPNDIARKLITAALPGSELLYSDTREKMAPYLKQGMSEWYNQKVEAPIAAVKFAAEMPGLLAADVGKRIKRSLMNPELAAIYEELDKDQQVYKPKVDNSKAHYAGLAKQTTDLLRNQLKRDADKLLPHEIRAIQDKIQKIALLNQTENYNDLNKFVVETFAKPEAKKAVTPAIPTTVKAPIKPVVAPVVKTEQPVVAPMVVDVKKNTEPVSKKVAPVKSEGEIYLEDLSPEEKAAIGG